MQQTCYANRWCESEKRKTLNKKLKVNWVASISSSKCLAFRQKCCISCFFIGWQVGTCTYRVAWFEKKKNLSATKNLLFWKPILLARVNAIATSCTSGLNTDGPTCHFHSGTQHAIDATRSKKPTRKRQTSEVHLHRDYPGLSQSFSF